MAHAGEFGQYDSREGDCDLSMRLSNATLGSLPGYIGRPGYDPSALRAGIVHLGLGAFHRAHQAVYTEAVLRDGDLRWGITAASLRSPAMRDALAPQDGLYTVAVRGNGEHLSVVGAIKRILVAPEDPSALIAAMAHPATEIVSLTVTEKAYCHDPATSTLDEAHPDILHDLAHPEAPRSALGFLAAGLARRRADGLRPFTVLCCDNLPANGRTVHRLLSRYAALLDRARDRGLAAFIAAEVACPDTMVDRIVPATTDADRGAISSALGMDDAWPVVTEPFSQWVVQDRFSLNRPAWEAAGVTLVDDVAPYEAMKLRMLNASHSALAYLGYLAGAETVADAMALPGLAEFAGRVMDEAVPTLPGGLDTGAYKRSLLSRFRNRGLRHRTWQIAMDGTQKLPQRIVATMQTRLLMGLPIATQAMVIAGWMRFVSGIDEAGQPIDVRDPMSAELARITQAAGPVPERLAPALLGLGAVFGPLGMDPAVRSAVVTALTELYARGAERAVWERAWSA